MQTYPTGYAESHRIAEQIFREILPRHGMAVVILYEEQKRDD